MASLLETAVRNTKLSMDKEIDRVNDEILEINKFIVKVSNQGKTSIIVDIFKPELNCAYGTTQDNNIYLYTTSNSFIINEIKLKLFRYYDTEGFEVTDDENTNRITIRWEEDLKELMKKESNNV